MRTFCCWWKLDGCLVDLFERVATWKIKHDPELDENLRRPAIQEQKCLGWPHATKWEL